MNRPPAAHKAAKPRQSKPNSAPRAAGLRARKRQETRERLTRAAMALFLERGFEATTLDDIAAAADISRRSFFHYFDSKEDVVFAWHEEITAAPDFGFDTWDLACLRACTGNPQISPLAKLH